MNSEESFDPGKQTEKNTINNSSINNMAIGWAEMINCISHPTFLLSADQKVVAVNQSALSYSKLSLDEILGKYCYTLFHEKTRTCPPEDCPCKKILSSNTCEISEMEVEAFDGIFLVSCTPLFDNEGKLQNILHIATDISEQKRTQKALAEGKKKLKSLISALPEGIVVHCNGLIEYINESALRIMKSNDPNYFIGKKAIDFVHPNYREFALERIKNSLFTTETSPFAEEIFIDTTGKEIYVEVCSIPFDYNGEKALLTIINDISSKKEIEKELLIINNAFETALTANCVVNIKGQIILTNPAFIHTFKFETKENAIGQHINCLFRNIEVSSIVSESLNNSGKWEGEFLAQRMDGSEFFAFGLATLLKNKSGEIIGYNTSCIDIDQNKKIELLLRDNNIRYQQLFEDFIHSKMKIEENEEKFRILVENVPGVVYMCKNDSNYSMIFMSKMIEQLTGYPAEHFLNGSLNITELYHPEEYDYIFNSVNEALDQNRQFHIIYRLKTNTGEWRWVEEYGRGLYINGQLYNLEGVMFDITQLKQKEIQLREQNIMIAAQNEELQKAKNKAEESDRLKSAFLANMSHEIRTPMNAICGFSDLLLDKSINDEKKQKFVQIIHTNSQQLLGIINDIIDISKIEAGQISISENKFSINTLLSEIENIFTPATKNKNLDLICTKALSDNESFIISDDLKIKQIFNNLIFNAIKFTRKGYINFGYTIENDFIQFFVKDSGIGIPEDKFEVAFARFQQIENKMESRHGGTGLGLPISKAYTELLGGSMWLESQPEIGSTFYFTIPFTPLKINHKQNGKSSQKVFDLSLFTILLAEDDDINFYFIFEILYPSHVNLIRAKDGREAIKIAKEVKIDLILMDVKMPDIDGLTATKEIRKFNLEIPIIAQTAYAFSSDRKIAIESGCTDFIAKPVKKELLFELIEKYLLQTDC